MIERILVVLTGFVALIAGHSAVAHHGRASYSDEFRFINPHVQIYFDITNDAGEVEHWQGELTAPNRLARAGWAKDTFVPGTRLQISGRAGRNDGHSVAINEIIMNGDALPLRESVP